MTSPTDLLIIPESQSCVMIAGHDVDMKLGGGGTAASQKFFFMPGTHQNMGRLSAWRTSDMKQVWTLAAAGAVPDGGDFHQRAGSLSWATSTAIFKAVDVKTGKVLWQTRLGNTVQGYPVTFSLDGKQYIAVCSGLGGGSPQQKPSMLLDEVRRPATGHVLYVFGLPD